VRNRPACLRSSSSEKCLRPGSFRAVGDQIDQELAPVFPAFPGGSAGGAHGLWVRVAAERRFLVAGVVA
jgi:hypothetical protein